MIDSFHMLLFQMKLILQESLTIAMKFAGFFFPDAGFDTPAASTAFIVNL